MIKVVQLYLITHYVYGAPAREWVDIAKYTEQGIALNDSCDGTFDNGKLIFSVDQNTVLGNLDVSQPIPPRLKLRIAEKETEISSDFRVSYVFETSDCAVTPLRTEQVDDTGNVMFIYSHEVNFVELTKDLEDKYPPNLSVRQPKNLYSRTFQRSTGWSFALDGATIKFADNSVRTIAATAYYNDKPDLNNETGIIAIENTSTGSIRVATQYENDGITPKTGIALEDYSFSFFMKLRATAPQIVNKKWLFIDDLRFVYAGAIIPISNPPYEAVFLRDNLQVFFRLQLRYYDSSDQIIQTIIVEREINWYGDTKVRDDIDPDNSTIPGNTNSTNSNTIIAPRNPNAAYMIATPSYRVPRTNMLYDLPGTGYGKCKNIIDLTHDADGNVSNQGSIGQLTAQGYNAYGTGAQKILVAYRALVYNVSIVSTSIKEDLLDDYKTLYDVAIKALNEINLKQRIKYSFSRRLTALLQSQKAPEITLQDYNLREILGKFCRMLEAIPILGDSDILDSDEDPLTTISYVKPGEQYRNFDFKSVEYVEAEQANTLAEYYDTISARLYNTISENDFHTETVLIQSAEDDYSQLTQDNAGFVVSYPIYWLRQIKINHANSLKIPFTYKNSGGDTVSAVIYGNDPNYLPTDAAHQSWDFSDRVFEEDIYNALPDVNVNTRNGRLAGFLSKANTLSYKSGEVFIKNTGHQGPNIPTFNIFASGISAPANLAIVEAAAVLAYQWLGNSADYPDFAIAQLINIGITSLLDLTAVITFTTLNEFTFRHTTNDFRKSGKYVEHRVNTQDKVSSYDDTIYYIKAEQNKQGNIIVSPTLIYPNITSCLPTGLRINDNYVITTRKLKIFEEYVECSYELTQNFVLQNDNVKLDIEFERYSIPFDFVWREVLVYTHILLGYNRMEMALRYANDPGHIRTSTSSTIYYNTSNAQYVDMCMGFNAQPSELYGRALLKYFVKPNGVPIQEDLLVLVKFHLLKSPNGLTYIGKFVDNYSAGNQVWREDNYNYSQPFRYSDSLGKTRSLQLEVFPSLGVYDIKKFPDVAGTTVNYSNMLVNTREPNDEIFRPGDDKDAREGYEFNVTGAVEALTPDILVFSAATQATHISVLLNDPDNLNINTLFSDLQFWYTGAIGLLESSHYNRLRKYTILIPIDNVANVPEPGRSPIAIWSQEGDKNTIKYILKNYSYRVVTNPRVGYTGKYMEVVFYAAASRYGQYDNK